MDDEATNSAPLVADLLDNSDVRVLAYYGDQDWTCNWRQGEAWVTNTSWLKQKEFNAAPYSPFYARIGDD